LILFANSTKIRFIFTFHIEPPNSNLYSIQLYNIIQFVRKFT